jgi:hypothetical protein
MEFFPLVLSFQKEKVSTIFLFTKGLLSEIYFRRGNVEKLTATEIMESGQINFRFNRLSFPLTHIHSLKIGGRNVQTSEIQRDKCYRYVNTENFFSIVSTRE